eukprot:1160540-Pelagomonas_calceolata.AAC.9
MLPTRAPSALPAKCSKGKVRPLPRGVRTADLNLIPNLHVLEGEDVGSGLKISGSQGLQLVKHLAARHEKNAVSAGKEKHGKQKLRGHVRTLPTWHVLV